LTNVSWSIVTPPGAAGAIAIIELRSPEAEALEIALHELGLAPLPVGTVKWRPLLGIDTGLVARWTQHVCHLMPHGGIGVLRSLSQALVDRGISFADAPEFPEAPSPVEARLLRALARAASPLAIDLLLDQTRRWAAGDGDDPGLNRILNRLIDPPLIVALGPPNIGKSTLINTLSGREVSIVADEPGTTRDHIGVWLNLGGLVVRYLDTPGLREAADPIERRARDIALAAATKADLLLLMGDAGSPPPDPIPGLPVLRLALRSDLGTPSWSHDIAVSAARGHNLAGLADLIRESLVPTRAIADPRPWRFWADPATV
jgi:hypothetical protein